MALRTLVLEVRNIADWIGDWNCSEWGIVIRVAWLQATRESIRIGLTHTHCCQWVIEARHALCHCAPCGWLLTATSTLESSYYIALLGDDFAILSDHTSQSLNAIMLVYEASSNFTVTLDTGHWHVRTLISEMVPQLFASLEHYSLASIRPFHEASEWARNECHWAFKLLVLYQLFVAHRLSVFAFLSFAFE